jgi:hypothetical protein
MAISAAVTGPGPLLLRGEGRFVLALQRNRQLLEIQQDFKHVFLHASSSVVYSWSTPCISTSVTA